ncbi:MAG: PilN domain-containing protein [Pseudomonadales bacterium]|jgi:type IV pilus assembly protein PilN|nr:PilN domain-containing protein [Pseudomonadales bacterium]
MTRINLLPWREELREERKKEFLQYLALVLLVAGGLVFVSGTWISGRIEDQTARNNYLRKEIKVLDERIAEIRDLARQREELLARMQVIQELQGNRPVIVRVFDELVRSLAKGVFYTRLSFRGDLVTVSGVAESNNRVSELMRNVDASQWFTDPNLKGLREAPNYGPQASTFELTFKQTLPGKTEEEAE